MLTAKGSFFLNYGGSHTAPLLPFRMALLTAECGFQIQNTFHWVKSIAVPLPCGLVTLGQFRPVPSDRYANDCHEFVFHLTKGGDTPINRESIGVPYTDKSNLERHGHRKDLHCRGNTWFIPYETIRQQNQRPHPASFSKDLARNCILLHGARQDLVVLNPFLGIGSSARAALDCGVETFIGFDIDRGVCAIRQGRPQQRHPAPVRSRGSLSSRWRTTSPCSALGTSRSQGLADTLAPSRIPAKL